MMTTLINGAYHSLSQGQFRLMRLGTDLESLVSGQLEETVLANAPPYYAISHAWVPGVSVKATPQSNQIQLSHYLAICVRRLQKFGFENTDLDPRITHIWLDSICINQQDVHERSQQVSMMGRIYSQSARTLIWLGDVQLPSIYIAWNLIADIYAIFEKQNPRAKALSDIPARTYDKRSHIASGLPSMNDSQWGYMKALMELRWFTRMWVVQEVVLSQQDPIILHGDHQYAWEPLGWAVGWLRRSGYLRLPQIPEQLRNVDTISNLRRAQTRWPLAALMSITQVKFNATDQRDKIYGVLGLALECEGPGLPEELKPDYTIDTATLYQRVASFLLIRKHSLAILTRARSIDGTETRNQCVHNLVLPSWCPDWSDFATYNEGISTSFAYIEYSDIFKPAMFGFPKQYRAANGLELSLHTPESGYEDGSILQLGGFRVDQVAHVHRFNIDSSRHGQTSDEFDAIKAPIIDLSLSLTSISDTLTWMEHFIRTTTASQHYLCGKGMDQSISDGALWLYRFLNRREDSAWLLYKKTSKEKVKLQIGEASANGVEEDYVALVWNFCFDRSFITTANGRIGIAPSNTCRGDTVAVILGGGVPYIIRSSGEHWNLVGEAYIDGLMEGETIDMYTKGSIQKEALSFT
ncbi:het-6-heterokaryon incompatibility [Fusarium globosum]|uniref:Het-6-heterokaryon incompatibility n=1 Tax=Fusarium globosum TaxID=78864 RepID=A0A8H6DH88_9HYPO|nr:het-6-heterokaryon incompatibility [Fusarium globosum]